MVAGFNRSFSLPGSPRHKTRPGYHVRSISLPSHSHPLISHLHHNIQSLYSWQSQQPISVSVSVFASWICDGLTRLDLLHSSLHHLLSLPQNQQQDSKFTPHVLDDFLRFTDIYDTFRCDVMAINEHLSNAQIAIRRHDRAMLLSSISSVKKTRSKFVKTAGSLRFSDTEIGVGVVGEVISVTVEATVTILSAMSGILSYTVVMGKSSSWPGLRRLSPSTREEGEEWRRGLMMRLEELQCVRGVECGCERLLRGLISTRVSLLNIMSC